MKNQPVVVVRKRRSPVQQGHHGGAWKIAYADFMTAMMAFFLVMWLLAIASPQDLSRIAEYFRTPLNVALSSGPRSSTDSSPIPGGGDDPTRQQGDVHKSLDNLMEKLEKKRLNQLRERLDQLIESDPRLRVLRPQLLINLVQEGLQIQILDSQNRPMFETGSALVEPYMRDVLRGIAPILNDIPNKISVSGHTDATPYANGERGYSNWELSADRANASRRELISGGLSEGKILRVVGMSSTMSLAPQQPFAAINRRISLVVLNKQTEEMIEHENAQNPAVEVNGSKELTEKPAFKDATGAPAAASQPVAPGANATATGPAAPDGNAPAATTQPAAPGGNAPAAATQPAAPGGNAPAAATQPAAPGGNAPAAATQPAAPGGNAPAAATQPAAPGGNAPAPAAQPAIPTGSTPARGAHSRITTAITPAPDARTLVPARGARSGVTTTITPAPDARPAAPAPTAPAAPASGARVNILSGNRYGVTVSPPFENMTAPATLWFNERDSAGGNFMSMDISAFYQTFFDEAAELLADMEQHLLILDPENPDSEQLNAIFRAAHSIKGGAGTFGFTVLQETTHLLENLLDEARRGEMSLSTAIVNLFLEPKISCRINWMPIRRLRNRTRRALNIFAPRYANWRWKPKARYLKT